MRVEHPHLGIHRLWLRVASGVGQRRLADLQSRNTLGAVKPPAGMPQGWRQDCCRPPSSGAEAQEN